MIEIVSYHPHPLVYRKSSYNLNQSKLDISFLFDPFIIFSFFLLEKVSHVTLVVKIVQGWFIIVKSANMICVLIASKKSKKPIGTTTN